MYFSVVATGFADGGGAELAGGDQNSWYSRFKTSMSNQKNWDPLEGAWMGGAPSGSDNTF